MTTIAFMYNRRLQVCHAGNLLMRLNILFTPSNPHLAQRMLSAHIGLLARFIRLSREPSAFLPHGALEG